MHHHCVLTSISFMAGLSPFVHAATTTVSNADIALMQMYSIAPNFDPASASWNQFVNNLIAGSTSSGFNNSGAPNSPSYFRGLDDILIKGQLPLAWRSFTTGGGREFNSWLGQANPGQVFGPAFANETGSQLHSPFLVLASGGPIRITNITTHRFSAVQNGGMVPVDSFTNNRWSAARIGVTSFGPDGVLGGGDDSYVTSGNMADTLVLAYITTGPGIGLRISRQMDGGTWPASLADEDLFDAYSEQWGDLVHDYRLDWEVNYTKDDNPSFLALQGDTVYTVIPEPSSALYLISCGLVFSRRRMDRRRVVRS